MHSRWHDWYQGNIVSFSLTCLDISVMKHISLQEAFGERRAWGPTVLPHPRWVAVHLATADAKIKDPVSALLKLLLLKIPRKDALLSPRGTQLSA